MSLTAYKKNVRDSADNTYSYTGACFETGARFTRILPTDLRIEEHVTDATTVHQYYVANAFAWSVFETPFYDGSKVFSISEYITKGISSNVTGIVNTLHSWLMSEVQANHSNVSKRSCEDSTLSSKQQCMIKSAGGSAAGAPCMIPSIEVNLGSNTYIPGQIHDHQFSCRFALYLRTGTWSDANNCWYAPGQQLVRFFDFSGTNTSVLESNLIDFINSILKLSYSMGPTPELVQDGDVFRINQTLAQYDRHFIWVRNESLFPYGFFVIDTDFANFGGGWNGSGDVDPTDPWEQPDPYDPIPPGPVPPGPVDPVDPVDPVPEPDYPPIDGASIGIYKVYKPDNSQLRSIAAKLWDPTAWEAIKQMFTNPMDALLGLAIVPVAPLVTSPEDVYLGRYNTRVSVPRVSSDYVTIDCGSVAIKKFYGSYLDHDPYTKYTLYLPYIGELDINADEITGKTVHIKYHCNVVTGDCVAIVMIDSRVCYTAMGNIIRQLPLSQTDFSSIIQTAVSAAATMLQTAQSYSNGVQNAAAGVAAEKPSQVAHGTMQASTAAINGVASTLNNVASMKLGYKHAGKIGQGAAQLSVQKPFFTVSRPNLSLPEGIDGARNSSQKRYTGYPANYIDELRNFHGFTIVEECQLNMLGATDVEIAEAAEILKGGAYL